MKEKAKLVLPKIAQFKEEEDENDAPATFKEDEESKTRSNRKRKTKVKSLSENLPRISSSGKLNLTCLGVGERDAGAPDHVRKENNAMPQTATGGPAVNMPTNPFLPSCMSPSKIYRSITVTGQRTLFDRVELTLPEPDPSRVQKTMKWPAVPWIFPERKRLPGTEDLAYLLLITRAKMRTRLPRVAIEGWVPGTVAVPTFHCRKCLTHWRACGELPQDCKEPEKTVEGPPMYLTGKANFRRKMPIKNAYNTADGQLQICIDVTAGRQSSASAADLGALDTTEVDAETLWDLRPTDLDHNGGSDDSVLDDNVQFLSHSQMSTNGHSKDGYGTGEHGTGGHGTGGHGTGGHGTGGHGTGGHGTGGHGTGGHGTGGHGTGGHGTGGHGTGGHGTGGHGTGGHGTGGHGTGGHGTGGHGTGGHGTGGHGSLESGTTTTQLPPIIVPSNISGNTQVACATSVTGRHSVLADNFQMHEGGEYPSSMNEQFGSQHQKRETHTDGHSGQGMYSKVSSADGGGCSVGTVAQDSRTDQLHGGRGMIKNGQGRMTGNSKRESYGARGSSRGDDGAKATSTYSREYIEGSDSAHYGRGQKQGTGSLHSYQGSGHGAKRSSDRKGGDGTAGRNRSSALAEGEDQMGSMKSEITCSSNRNEQSLQTSSTTLSPPSLRDDKSTLTGKHEGHSDRNEQSRRPEHQSMQSPASSRLRSSTSTVESNKTSAADPSYGTAPGQGQPRTQERKVVRQATIKENVEYVPEKVKVGKKKKAQLKKGVRPTDSGQTISKQGSAVNRRGSYVLAQTGSQNGMHQIDTSKLEEQRQSGVGAAAQGTTAAPRALRNTTKSRDASFPTRHNSKVLDEVVHQSPDLYRNKKRPSLQHADINPSTSQSGSQRISSGWKERGDLQKAQKSSRLRTKDKDVLATDATTSAGGVSVATNVKGDDKKLHFSYGADSESSTVHKFLQQQSQALDSRRPSSSTEQPTSASKGKAAGGTLTKASTTSGGTGTASVSDSEGTTSTSVKVEAKVSKCIGSEDSLGTISEASEGDVTQAEVEYYTKVHSSSFDLMSMMNFTRSFTYSMFSMSKQHKESYNATHTTSNTGRRQIKRTTVKS